MQSTWIVELTEEERRTLKSMIAGGETKARRLKRAQILLAADQRLGHKEISRTVGAGTATVYRIKRSFVEGGLESALSENPRPGAERKLTAQHEARLTAIACTDPPQGRARWTLQLLADELVRLTDLDEVSYETVRRRLHENELKPWQRKMWCIPVADADYVARMEAVLDLYAQPHDPKRPVVCFDETPVQLIGEARAAWPAEPGKAKRVDYEYRRNGTANLFVYFDRHRRWRHVDVTDQRTKRDFADCMKALVKDYYPDADTIRVVMDNLNTHRPGALYERFEPQEARDILRRLEFHYTPKHASWLNMAEIEIGVLSKQCLAERIPDRQLLAENVAAWEAVRNEERATINWLFDVDRARRKMRSVYPSKPL